MSGVEPVSEGELIEIKATPVPAEPRPGEVRLRRPVSKALAVLGPALAFVGREIVPRLAASLLDAWDRRASRSTALPGGSISAQPVQRQRTSPPAGSGRRQRRQHRQRGRG